jgi:hypothetical protein
MRPTTRTCRPLLAFYAYLILGWTSIRIPLYGGDPYLLTAAADCYQYSKLFNQRTPGWRPADGGKNRNRYWIIENLLNPRVTPLPRRHVHLPPEGTRYVHHRSQWRQSSYFAGAGRVDKVNTAYFNSMIVQMFANAKKDELVEMWKLGAKAQKDGSSKS